MSRETKFLRILLDEAQSMLEEAKAYRAAGRNQEAAQQLLCHSMRISDEVRKWASQ